MKNYVIKERKTGKVVSEETLRGYVFPVSATPLMPEIRQIAIFQNEISQKYYKVPENFGDKNYKDTVSWILNYYDVPEEE